MVFVFGGIAWAALTRRARAVHHLRFEEGARPVGSKRGVEAIFSPEEGPSPQGRAVTRASWVSRRLIADIVELSLLLVFYAGFVQDYLSNYYLQSWIRATFPWGRYVLNYYALLTAGAIVGFLMIWLIQKQRQETFRS
jgi:hypothetical protein